MNVRGGGSGCAGGWQQGRGAGRGWRGGRGNWRGGNTNYFKNRGRGVQRHRGGRGGKTTPNQPGGGGCGLRQTTLPQAVPTPYKGWHLYFPEQVYSDHSPTVKMIQLFEKYLISWKSMYNFSDVERKGHFCVDFKQLQEDEVVHEGCPDLASQLKQIPDTVTETLGLAMHQLVYHELLREEVWVTEASGSEKVNPGCLPFNLAKIHCRVTNYDPVTPLKHLKANCYGKFVSVKGTVVRVSNIKPLCTRMAFECTSCGTIQTAILPEGKYVMPSKCPAEDCRGRTFQPKRSHVLTETIDWQTVRVQEIMNDDRRESGRIPRTVDCELTEDLDVTTHKVVYMLTVDNCVPGDVVSISGVVKVMGADEGHSRQKDKCLFLLYIHANSVTNAKRSSNETTGGTTDADSVMTSGLAMEFSIKELYAIDEIHSEKNIFRLLVGSLCPTIYGHELVKAGLILGLFGGTHRFANDKNRVPVRGDPHILIVGDPGLGKSQMLQAVTHVAPRSVYVCGNTTTISGLTVTLSKEAGAGGDYALEAGALVLADQGCCCIDEFDKMGTQHQALLEAMEQQSISIAKAGIVCSLPARTSIMAAANPVGGHYNKAKTVAENLRMGSALLSRFDLVFILLDKPDEEIDSMLSEYVMALHAGKKRSLGSTPSQRTPQVAEDDAAHRQWEADKPLSEKLKVQRWEPFDPIPAVLLRKYIGYARRYVHPKVTAEAATVLQEFYLNLRRKHHTQDGTPITTRQLESLIRLTEARARLELREECSEQDAREVVEIMKYSMIDTYTDEFGQLDFQRSQHGSGMSSKSQAKRLIGLLQRRAEQTCNSLFSAQEIRQIAKDADVVVRDFEDFLASLNNQGFLLKKGPRIFQLQTTSY